MAAAQAGDLAVGKGANVGIIEADFTDEIAARHIYKVAQRSLAAAATSVDTIAPSAFESERLQKHLGGGKLRPIQFKHGGQNVVETNLPNHH